MKRLRRRSIPEQVLAIVVPEGDRRLAWAVTEQGDALLATSSGLVLPAGAPLAWTQVEKVVWSPPRLTVTEVAEVEGTGRARTYPLAEQDEFASTVRAQVTSSVAWSDRRRLDPKGGVRLVGRRVPGQDALLWQQVFDRDTDALDPLLRAQAQEMLEAVRRTIG